MSCSERACRFESCLGYILESWQSGLSHSVANREGLKAPKGSNPLLSSIRKGGRVRLNAPVLKTGHPERGAWVRIPLLPQLAVDGQCG
jgi:hypothetical protein